MSDDETGRAIPDTGFKLRPLIQSVLSESDATELDDLALEILSQIKRHDWETALFQAIRALARESWRPAFIPTQQTVRSEQREQAPAVAPERDGRQWLTPTGELIDEAGVEPARRPREEDTVNRRPLTLDEKVDLLLRLALDNDLHLRDCAVSAVARANAQGGAYYVPQSCDCPMAELRRKP